MSFVKQLFCSHDWGRDCTQCSRCGKKRDVQHSWQGCKCSLCGKARNEGHDWQGCKCAICRAVRDRDHDWSRDCELCSICGLHRGNTHEWTNEDTCRICGISKPWLFSYDWNGAADLTEDARYLMRKVWEVEGEVNAIIESEVMAVMGKRTATEQAAATAVLRAMLVGTFKHDAKTIVTQVLPPHRDKLLRSIRTMIADTLKTAIATEEQHKRNAGASRAVPVAASSEETALAGQAPEQARSAQTTVDMKKVVWSVVDPLETMLQDPNKIIALGPTCVPVVIDVFLHPKEPTTGIACNQAVLACVLDVFAGRGNKEAAAFLRRVASDEVDLFDTGGQTAYEIAKRFADSQRTASQPTPQNANESKMDGDQISQTPYTFDDAINHARMDSGTVAWPDQRVRLQDLATQLSAIKAGTTDINAKDRNGWTALTAAARFGHTDTVKLLLSRGANVNAEGYLLGVTALMSATTNGRLDTVKLLLASGANVNACDLEGNTALTLAVSCNHPDIVPILLSAGGDIATKRRGKTLLMMASKPEMTELLKAHGARE